jgi:osmotically-inducible protein OsmY
MKGWLLAFVVVAFTLLSVVIAKQSDSEPNLRVVDQDTQRTTWQQSNKPVDVLTTKNIRAELMKDDALSIKAKNIKIFAFNNGITLKGTVKSDDERAKVLKHAYLTAPKYKIYNQITVVR